MGKRVMRKWVQKIKAPRLTKQAIKHGQRMTGPYKDWCVVQELGACHNQFGVAQMVISRHETEREAKLALETTETKETENE